MNQQDRRALGRYKRAPDRWDTSFGRWVSEVTVTTILDTLGENPDIRYTRQSVYGWLKGAIPRPAAAAALLRMSRGAISLEDIYEQGAEITGSLDRVLPSSPSRERIIK